jgi:hypothetical protein
VIINYITIHGFNIRVAEAGLNILCLFSFLYFMKLAPLRH